tara:strand:+ start:110 stop:985 length:876 start_codon:yes stop_codon:yes gene_type:complete
MEYLNGINVKPYSVDEVGNVHFTDGTNNNIRPSQFICESYGYRYDTVSGSCMAFAVDPNLPMQMSGKNNLSRGSNDIGLKTDNGVLIGNNNTTNINRNVLVVGTGHELESYFNNSSVLGGSRAIITRDSEIAIGGGKQTFTQVDGEDTFTTSSRRQTSTIELSGTTMDNTATNLTVQGDGSSFINVKANSIIGYDIYITRLELGGSSGTAGNYSYRNIRGAVKIDRNYTMSFVVGFSRNIAKIGQNGTTIMADTSTSTLKSISVNVQDRNNVHNLWSASVTLHEVISETAF